VEQLAASSGIDKISKAKCFIGHFGKDYVIMMRSLLSRHNRKSLNSASSLKHYAEFSLTKPSKNFTIVGLQMILYRRIPSGCSR
jgi:hypothetical protein